VVWFAVPHETLQRLATIPEQIQGGDLGQRENIWSAGWHAFAQAPLFGNGAGSFVSAAGLNPLDTAHNTVLSIAVGGGLCALFLAGGIVAMAVWSTVKTRGPLRLALGTALLVWFIGLMAATAEENRTTWLLLGLIALAGRLAVEEPAELATCFPDSGRTPAAGQIPAAC
jgi:O-antigen ligase